MRCKQWAEVPDCTEAGRPCCLSLLHLIKGSPVWPRTPSCGPEQTLLTHCGGMTWWLAAVEHPLPRVQAPDPAGVSSPPPSWVRLSIGGRKSLIPCLFPARTGGNQPGWLEFAACHREKQFPRITTFVGSRGASKLRAKKKNHVLCLRRSFLLDGWS